MYFEIFLCFTVVLKKPQQIMGTYRSQSDQNEHFWSLYVKMLISDNHYKEGGHPVVLLTAYASDFKYCLKK